MQEFRAKFKHFDLLGITPSFFCHSDIKIRTIAGSIISIIVICYTSFLTIYFSLQMAQKKNPILYSYHDYKLRREEKLNLTNFFIGVSIESGNGTKIEFQDSFFQYRLVYEELKNGKENFTPENKITLVDCNEVTFDNFPEVTENLKEEIKTKSKCININNNILKGSQESTRDYKTLTFELSYNPYLYYEFYNENQDLFPLQVKIFFQTFSYDINNHKEPFSKDIGMFKIFIGSQSVQSYLLTFVNGISRKDDNIFFSEINETSLLGFSSFRQLELYSKEFTSSNFQKLLSFNVNFEPYNLIYTRKYMKIQEAVAQIVSFSNIGLLFGDFLLNLIKKTEILALLESFQFNLKNHTQKKKISPFSTTERKRNPESSSFFTLNLSLKSPKFKNQNPKQPTFSTFTSKFYQTSEISNSNKYLLSRAAKVKQLKSSKNLKLNYFNTKKHKKNYSLRGEILEFLEFEYLIKNYEELQRLKAIILNSSQLYLFKYIGTLYNFLDLDHNCLSPDCQLQASEYFLDKTSQGTLNELDKKLLSILNEKEKSDFFFSSQKTVLTKSLHKEY